MSFRETLSQFWFNVQHSLFPWLENNIGVLSDDHKRLISVLELVRIEELISSIRCYEGRPPKDRCQIARALIAKILFRLPTITALIRTLNNDLQLKQICGWEAHAKIPDANAFSRAFKVFSKFSISEQAHQMLISEMYKDKLVMHLVKDSTPIVAREKAQKRTMSRKKRKKFKDKEILEEKKYGKSRKQRQLIQDLTEMLAELPRICDIGAKTGSSGYRMVWKGYKLHACVDDYGLPIAAIITSASLNDSEVAIPLAIKCDKLVVNCYDLMDSAYDDKEIKEHSFALGHVPIIDPHSRSKKQKEEKIAEAKRRRILNFYPAEKTRYKERLSKERFNATIKDYYGGENIYYRGYEKIACQIMFGVLCLTATTLLKMLQ